MAILRTVVRTLFIMIESILYVSNVCNRYTVSMPLTELTWVCLVSVMGRSRCTHIKRLSIAANNVGMPTRYKIGCDVAWIRAACGHCGRAYWKYVLQGHAGALQQP